MSLESWKLEFYPVPAEVVAKRGQLAMVDQAILKWRGLTKANLRRHKVQLVSNTLVDMADRTLTFEFGGPSCALCLRYSYSCKYCVHCPLARARREHDRPVVSCDHTRLHEKYSPWYRMTGIWEDPGLMLRWLNITREQLLARRNKQ